MQPPHIGQIHIENFKCFKKLDIPEFRQINLIGGKNNVGKTALLEAIEVFSQSKYRHPLLFFYKVAVRRKSISNDKVTSKKDMGRDMDVKLDFMYNDSAYLKISSHEYTLKVKDIDNDYLSSNLEEKFKAPYYEITINKSEMKVNKNDEVSNFIYMSPEQQEDNIKYIEPSRIDEQKVAFLYGSLIDLNKESFLNDSLAIFDEDLIAMKQRAIEGGVVLKIQKKDREHPVLLSSLGDGVNRYIAILCAIWASQDGILLIDEIENGIHYTNYPKLWDLIFKVAKEANCQLFITSHSKECIEAFNHIQLTTNHKESLYLELFRSKKSGLIKSSAREPEQLKYALTHEGKIRGE